MPQVLAAESGDESSYSRPRWPP